MSNIVPAPPLPKLENVNHPEHYNNCSLECWDVMRIAFTEEELIAFCKINAFKYLWRYKYKNGLEDVEKAKWYLDKINDYDHNWSNDDAYTVLYELVRDVIWSDNGVSENDV